MIKLFVLMLTFNPATIHAIESGVQGCGEYIIKGTLEKADPVVYKVNEGTKSELRFDIKEKEDLVLISSYLNVPTTITAQILKKMDGTKGEIKNISKLTLRRPDPLNPTESMGIALQKAMECVPTHFSGSAAVKH